MDITVPTGSALLLDFIYRTDAGKAPPECYDTIFGNRQSGLTKPITKMTLGELIDAQKTWSTKAWAKKFGSDKASSAAGAPQFMRTTPIDLAKELHLSGAEVFNADFQGRQAFHLLKRRGYEAFMSGKIDRTEFGKRLAMEWASFPVLAACKGAHRQIKRGDSYYLGDGINKVGTQPLTVEALLDRVKAAGNHVQASQPVVVQKPRVVERPVVADPGELETPTTKSKTFWTWLLTAIGAPLAAFGNLDWRVQLVIVAFIVALPSTASSAGTICSRL